MTIYFQRHIFHNITILLALITLLSSCSSTRLIYTFIDDFIQDEVTYFIDLDTKEELLLSQQVSKMVTWHRKSMLPRYADYFNDIADKIEVGKYDDIYIKKILENGKFLIEQTVTGLTPYASKFLVQHQTIENIKIMKKRMATRQKERLDELSEPEEILYKNRLNKFISNFERFFGDLSNEQVKLIEVHARDTLNDSSIRLHNRSLRQKAFINFIKNQPSETELMYFLNKLLLRGHLITNPTYQAFSEMSLIRFRILLVNMLAISSEAQKETIISNLRDYAYDFKDLSE